MRSVFQGLMIYPPYVQSFVVIEQVLGMKCIETGAMNETASDIVPLHHPLHSSTLIKEQTKTVVRVPMGPENWE